MTMKYRDKRLAMSLSAILIILILIVWIFYNRLVSSYMACERMRAREAQMLTAVPEVTTAVTAVLDTSIATTAPIVISEPAPFKSTLFHEYDSLFEETMRNCLGTKCFDEKVKLESGNLVERVGILAPSLSGAEILSQIIQESIPQPTPGVIIEVDTRVPTYGYGKNHGWTRIVRLYRNIAPHALSLLGNASTVELIDPQIRQLMRWHCRLNHVAAHTKMLTIFTNDLVVHTAVEIEKIISFAGHKVGRPEIAIAVKKYKDKLIDELGLPPKGESRLKDMVTEDFQEMIGNAMKSEWEQTNALNKWPCPSFRQIDEEVRTKHSTRLTMDASMLSPNCSHPLVKCSVQYDLRGG